MYDDSKFKYFNRFEDFDSETFLGDVINLAIHAYLEILKSKKYVKSQMKLKRENVYRDDLVEMMANIQEKYGLDNLIINCEAQEKINDCETGLLDIKVQYRNLKSIRFINKCYHTIECKRFDKIPNISDYYTNGLLKFINGDYSKNTNYAAIFCFVEEFKSGENMDDLIIRIDNYLAKKQLSALNKVYNNYYNQLFEFQTNRFEEKLNIFHLMLDYTSIYSDN